MTTYDPNIVRRIVHLSDNECVTLLLCIGAAQHGNFDIPLTQVEIDTLAMKIGLADIEAASTSDSRPSAPDPVPGSPSAPGGPSSQLLSGMVAPEDSAEPEGFTVDVLDEPKWEPYADWINRQPWTEAGKREAREIADRRASSNLNPLGLGQWRSLARERGWVVAL